MKKLKDSELELLHNQISTNLVDLRLRQDLMDVINELRSLRILLAVASFPSEIPERP
jgi:hypothetical protein